MDIPQDIHGIDLGPSPTAYEGAEGLAAEAYGAARSFFLTNGATQGNHTLCLALAPLGTRIVAQRNSHASVVDGLVLSGGVPHFVAPEYDAELGMAHGVTVEALAEALRRYQGTVIFTSHDRHFMQRVCTAVIEVAAGRVASYPGSYEDYVYRVHKELEAGLRAEHAAYNAGASRQPAAGQPTSAGGSKAPMPTRKLTGREERELEKRIKALERRIARLDEQKRELTARLMEVSDAAESKRIGAELARLSEEVAALEHEWLEASGEI
jgi:hypothetical protein